MRLADQYIITKFAEINYSSSGKKRKTCKEEHIIKYQENYGISSAYHRIHSTA